MKVETNVLMQEVVNVVQSFRCEWLSRPQTNSRRYNKENWFVTIRSDQSDQKYRVRRWIAGHILGKIDENDDCVFTVAGVKFLQGVIVKLSLDWLKKLYIAGQVLNPHSCSTIYLLELLLKVMTSQTSEAPRNGTLENRASQRSVILSLPFFLDYVIECFEFNLGTSVFAFMEFVVDCKVPESSQERDSEVVSHLFDDIFMTHILSTFVSVQNVMDDFRRIHLEVRYLTETENDISRNMMSLLDWLRLDCVASRRSKRYSAQRSLTRFVAELERGDITCADPIVEEIIRRIVTHKEVFRLTLLQRLIRIHERDPNITNETKQGVEFAFSMIHSRI